MPRITQLPSLSTPDGADELAIVDASASVTKKITRTDFLSGAPLPNNTVTTASITDASVTTAKIADGAIINSNLNTTAGELGGVWQSWSPTLTNLTIGSGVITARYTKVGKTINFRIKIKLSGSTMGSNPRFTLPVEAFSGAGDDEGYVIARNVRILDSGTAAYGGFVKLVNSSTTVAEIYVEGASGTYSGQVSITSTVPMTWANNDTISIIGMYEAA